MWEVQFEIQVSMAEIAACDPLSMRCVFYEMLCVKTIMKYWFFNSFVISVWCLILRSGELILFSYNRWWKEGYGFWSTDFYFYRVLSLHGSPSHVSAPDSPCWHMLIAFRRMWTHSAGFLFVSFHSANERLGVHEPKELPWKTQPKFGGSVWYSKIKIC